ncbi:MAG: hypothetical protein K0Q72_3371 [Armatimonadetes bacterium]|nr:hypothetical protein [Armatimonadota bacterium]
MPPGYVLAHAALTALAVFLARRCAGRRGASLLTGALLALAAGGLIVERSTELAWSAMQLGWPDLVFFTNFTLPGVAALMEVIWSRAADPGARRRAVILSPLALGAAVWSYAWCFAPVPAGLTGQADPSGYCAQSSSDSCSAAAAVMLLHTRGVRATEAEMAELCLTREGHGTTPLGLFRGLALKARQHRLQAALVRARAPSGRPSLPGPGIVSVGLSRFVPREVAERLDQFGWQPGLRHAVLFREIDAAGKWISVYDPSFGRERWRNGADLEWLWDGLALTIQPMDDGRTIRLF